MRKPTDYTIRVYNDPTEVANAATARLREKKRLENKMRDLELRKAREEEARQKMADKMAKAREARKTKARKKAKDAESDLFQNLSSIESDEENEE